MNKYNQLCVWECTTLGRDTKSEFEKFFKDNGFDIKFAEEVETNINYPYGVARHDVLFYINDDDIAEFSIWRLRFGIKWWEDIVKYNNHSDYYKEETLEKYPVKW